MPDRAPSSAVSRARPNAGGVPRRARRLTRAEAQAVTRRRLLDAASVVFCAKGFHATSLADVADQAGYTIGAVYSNFASKDALFHAMMNFGLSRFEASLEAAFSGAEPGASASQSVAELVEAELDRMQRGEDAVPATWWRLLAEFRAYAATNPAARAELATSERRCRDIIATHIDRFAEDAGIELPMPATELADLTTALTDGLRAAHAEGRIAMTSGHGLRRVVAAMLEGAARTANRT
jgi:AcrR family transcriptional regulator